jgi:hypothetical protein
MRRIISPVLIGVGAFLIVAGVLIKVYAVPTLAVVPSNYDSTTYLEATDATIFNSDPDVLAPETVDLEVSSHTVAGDYPDAPDGVVVWANNVTTTPVGWDEPFQQSRELTPFDENTGAAADFPEASFEEVENEEGDIEQVEVTREGQIYKFPFDTQKKDYQQWDSELGEATTAKYEGEEELEGTTVYKFVQTIEPTVIDTVEVPGSIFDSEEDSVQAEMIYEMTRTLYVEPTTGAPLNRVEERNQVLSYDGTEVPAFVGTVQYTEQSQADSLDRVHTRATLLRLAEWVFPIGAVVLGLLAIGGGVLLRRRQGDQPTNDEDHKHLVSA